MGSMPFSANGAAGAGPRPGSRGRSREEEHVFGGDLPVFAPRDGLPGGGMRNARPQSPSRGPPRPQSPSRGPPRPQSPARGPPRPQSPSRGPPRPQSPSRGPPRPQSPSRGPPRPQSPSRGPPRPQSPSRGPSPGRSIPIAQVERERRTPSPLKDIPEEIRELAEEEKGMHLPPVNRTPSPLRNGNIGETVGSVHPKVPLKDIPVPPKDIPLPPKDVPPVIVAASALPPPLLEKKDPLPPVPSVTTPTQPEVERSRSPSPDAEWRDDQEEQQLENGTPVDKRITVFLQEHGKRKELQGLPPLPTEPVPPLPTLPPLQTQAPPIPREPTPPVPTEPTPPVESPPQPVEAPPPIPPPQPLPVIPTTQDDPVERLKKHFDEPEPPSPLIPPPRAPVLESRGGMAPSASDSSIESHTATTNPVVEPRIVPSHRSFPSSSSIQHSVQHSRSASAVTPINHSREPSRDSPIHTLPELDVSRPFTWGPLTFEQAEPLKEDQEMPMFEDRREKLEDVDEESDWEKVEEEEAQEEPSSSPPVTSPKQPDRVAPEIPDAQRMSSLVDDTAPPDSDHEQEPHPADDEDEETADNLPDLPDHHTHKSPHPDDASNPASSDIEGDTHPSRYRDRDITSFIIQSRGLQSRDSDKPASRDSDRPVLPPLQTNPVPVPASNTQRMTLEFLPPFMLGKDIPDMTTVAQRVGAYQSRREQMVKTDTGLRGWLLEVSHSRPPSLPQRTLPLHRGTGLTRVEPPDLRRFSKESYGAPASPSTSALPFTGSGKVGRKMISKMVIGGKKLGAATKNTIDKLGTGAGDKRTSSGDVHYARASGEVSKDSPNLQRLSRDDSLESPVIRSSRLSQEPVYEEPELKDIAYGSQPVGLGVSTPTQATSMDVEAPTSFAQMQIPAQRPQSPYQPPRDDIPSTPINHSPRLSTSLANPVISKKESQGTNRHKFSSSISSVKVSKLFGISTTPEPKPKRDSDNSEYPSTSPQQSPRQKSKFSRFVNDLSQSSITGKSPQTTAVTASPPPPPPPDKSQFRSPSESSRLKGFLADLSSRDITGNKPQTSPGSPTSSPRVASDRPGTSGFSRFISELGKRDITGHTEEERIAAARRREKEATHIPAQPVLYDESASDWEVKLEKMEDVLPHIRRDVLVDSLKQAGGDEQRAIGLAVIKSR